MFELNLIIIYFQDKILKFRIIPAKNLKPKSSNFYVLQFLLKMWL